MFSDLIPNPNPIHIYLLATPEWSYEGLEGIVGYTPYAAYKSHREAEIAAEREIRAQFQDKPGLELMWAPNDNDDSVQVLSYSYLEWRRVERRDHMTESQLFVVQYGGSEQVRTYKHEITAILKIELKGIHGFIEVEENT